MTSDPDCQDGMCAPPAQDIKLEEYVCHTDYAYFVNLNDDICLFRLAKPIQFNSKYGGIEWCLNCFKVRSVLYFDSILIKNPTKKCIFYYNKKY